MKQSEIREGVEFEVGKWIELNKIRGSYTNITPKAIDFIVEVIENIQEDPLRIWKEEDLNYDFNYYQTFAISLIPNALNDVIKKRRPRIRYNDVEISTWDIWLSLSEIIRNWCFIPRDI